MRGGGVPAGCNGGNRVGISAYLAGLHRRCSARA
jgi:hypothetical protein